MPRLRTNAAAIRIKRRRIAPRRPGPSTEPKTVNQVRFELTLRRPPNALTRDWLALPASQHRLRRRTRGAIPPSGRVFSAAGEVHPEPVRFEARAVRMDDQSLSRMRIWLQVLLRAVHPRIHGAGRVGVREKDLCEEGCRAFAGARYFEQVFVCVGEVGRRKTGSYRHWDGDGPVSTGGAGTRGDASVPRGIGETRRVEHFYYNEVESDRA